MNRTSKDAAPALGRRAFLACAACALALAACSKPKPPKITPISARVTNVSLRGIDLEVLLWAYNPNGIDLEIKSVTAKVVLDHRLDAGTFTENRAVTLPANKKTKVSVPLKVRWDDVLGVAELATSNRDVDYLIDGHVELGGDLVRVNLPFQVNGTVTHAELMKAVGRAIPSGLPRIPGLTP